MVVAKVSSLSLSRRIFIRGFASSMSNANKIQVLPQNDQNPEISSGFEANIQFLKNKLHPDSLVHVLSSTDDLASSLQLFKWASLQNRFWHTADTYYHLILKLGMAGRVDEMEGYCNEMLKERFPGSEKALMGLMDEFIRYRKLDEALRVLFALNSFRYKPSISLINGLLGALVEEKKGFRSVLFVYKEMVKADIGPTIETLNYLLQALFDADRVDAAVDQYRRMRKKGCCPNSRTYEILVSGLFCKNLLDEAILVLDQVLESGCEFELSFFSCILPLGFRMNKPEVGLRLFEKMKASNIVPNSSIYEVLIQYYSKNLCIDNAINLFNEMIDNDLRPPDHVFVDLINGFCMLSMFSEAKKFLEDKQVREASPYNVILNGYCKAANFLEARSLFNKMVEEDMANSISWNIFIRFLSENGKTDEVSSVLSRMIVSAFVPDPDTYAALIVGKCKSNELDDALNMFHHVSAKCWVLDSASYGTLVESLCRIERIQEAYGVFHYMSSNRCALSASSFSMLVRGLCRIGGVEKLIKLMPLAYCSGKSCSSADYSTIMMGLSKLKKGNSLLVVLARMVVEGCRLDVEAYRVLIRSMSEHNRVTECSLFLNLMVNEGLLPDSEILADSLSCLAKHFQLHMILPTINKLSSEDEVLNPVFYNTLINGLWKGGYKNEARWLLDVMLEKGWVPDASTHRLLMSSGAMNGQASEVSADENLKLKDQISSILSDGFGELR